MHFERRRWQGRHSVMWLGLRFETRPHHFRTSSAAPVLSSVGDSGEGVSESVLAEPVPLSLERRRALLGREPMSIKSERRARVPVAVCRAA